MTARSESTCAAVLNRLHKRSELPLLSKPAVGIGLVVANPPAGARSLSLSLHIRVAAQATRKRRCGPCSPAGSVTVACAGMSRSSMSLVLMLIRRRQRCPSDAHAVPLEPPQVTGSRQCTVPSRDGAWARCCTAGRRRARQGYLTRAPTTTRSRSRRGNAVEKRFRVAEAAGVAASAATMVWGHGRHGSLCTRSAAAVACAP